MELRVPAEQDRAEQDRAEQQAASSILALQDQSATASVSPSSPPSLFPSAAIKRLLAELDIDCIVGFAHPLAKLLPVADPGCIALLHPSPEVICAHPTRIHVPEQSHELARLALLRGCGRVGIVCCHGV